MKNNITVLATLFLVNFSYATSFDKETQVIAQKLTGNYTSSKGEKVKLTPEQVAIMLKGESVKISDKEDIQFSKNQIEHKNELTTQDVTNLLTGKKSDNKK
jgi:hypothetical protein